MTTTPTIDPGTRVQISASAGAFPMHYGKVIGPDLLYPGQYTVEIDLMAVNCHGRDVGRMVRWHYKAEELTQI